MGTVYTRTEHGLLIPDRHASGREVAAAIQRYDRDLALELAVTASGPVWKVVRNRGPNRPAETVLVWTDERGVPLPLSMGLLELVKRHDRNSRHALVDMDAQNEKLRGERIAAAFEAVDESARDTARAATRGLGHFSGPVPRSPALAAARRRGRRTGRAA